VRGRGLTTPEGKRKGDGKGGGSCPIASGGKNNFPEEERRKAIAAAITFHSLENEHFRRSNGGTWKS